MGCVKKFLDTKGVEKVFTYEHKIVKFLINVSDSAAMIVAEFCMYNYTMNI